MKTPEFYDDMIGGERPKSLANYPKKLQKYGGSVYFKIQIHKYGLCCHVLLFFFLLLFVECLSSNGFHLYRLYIVNNIDG